MAITVLGGGGGGGGAEGELPAVGSNGSDGIGANRGGVSAEESSDSVSMSYYSVSI